MKRFARAIGLTMLLVCFLWAKTYPSTSKVQTYVSRDGSINLALDQSSSFLFAQQMEDTIRGERMDSIKLKDSNMAILYAVVPGIIIHGSGHFYAGKRKTGAILLASGVVGGALFFVGGLGVGLSQLDGGQSTWEPGYVFMATGGALFLGSWVYDMIGAPLAVQKYNEELLQKKNIGLEFDFNHRSKFVRFQIVKRF